MPWQVVFHKKAKEQYDTLSVAIQTRVNALVVSLEVSGAVQGEWPNYGKLATNRHHCHIKKGKPCYVVVWEVADKIIRLIEVQYVGTHENAPY